MLVKDVSPLTEATPVAYVDEAEAATVEPETLPVEPALDDVTNAELSPLPAEDAAEDVAVPGTKGDVPDVIDDVPETLPVEPALDDGTNAELCPLPAEDAAEDVTVPGTKVDVPDAIDDVPETSEDPIVFAEEAPVGTGEVPDATDVTSVRVLDVPVPATVTEVGCDEMVPGRVLEVADVTAPARDVGEVSIPVVLLGTIDDATDDTTEDATEGTPGSRLEVSEDLDALGVRDDDKPGGATVRVDTVLDAVVLPVPITEFNGIVRPEVDDWREVDPVLAAVAEAGPDLVL